MESRVSVNAAVEQVFGAWMERQRRTEWVKYLTSVRKLTDENAAPGSEYEELFHVAGPALNSTFQITELETNELIVGKWSGDINGQSRVTFDASNSTTTVVWTVDIALGGIKRVLVPLQRHLTTTTSEDLDRFKEMVELDWLTNRLSKAVSAADVGLLAELANDATVKWVGVGDGAEARLDGQDLFARLQAAAGATSVEVIDTKVPMVASPRYQQQDRRLLLQGRRDKISGTLLLGYDVMGGHITTLVVQRPSLGQLFVSALASGSIARLTELCSPETQVNWDNCASDKVSNPTLDDDFIDLLERCLEFDASDLVIDREIRLKPDDDSTLANMWVYSARLPGSRRDVIDVRSQDDKITQLTVHRSHSAVARVRRAVEKLGLQTLDWLKSNSTAAISVAAALAFFAFQLQLLAFYSPLGVRPIEVGWDWISVISQGVLSFIGVIAQGSLVLFALMLVVSLLGSAIFIIVGMVAQWRRTWLENYTERALPMGAFVMAVAVAALQAFWILPSDALDNVRSGRDVMHGNILSLGLQGIPVQANCVELILTDDSAQGEMPNLDLVMFLGHASGRAVVYDVEAGSTIRLAMASAVFRSAPGECEIGLQEFCAAYEWFTSPPESVDELQAYLNRGAELHDDLVSIKAPWSIRSEGDQLRSAMAEVMENGKRRGPELALDAETQAQLDMFFANRCSGTLTNATQRTSS